MTGAGSGGHITPILAVAHELKILDPTLKIIYIGQTSGNLSDIAEGHPDIDEVRSVSAGKLRRYHGMGWKQLFDIKTVFLNTRDGFKIILGFLQSFYLLGKIKPDIIFIKGGYIGVPVGLSAALRGIPYITHDSDAIPGLANRIIAPWAKIHTTALPKENYKYPSTNTQMVGVPTSSEYRTVDINMKNQYRKEIGLDEDSKVVVITGGGLGAKRINEMALLMVPRLLQNYRNLVVIHITGRAHEAEYQKSYDKLIDENKRGKVLVRGFVNDLYRYSGAADVIVTRAGASTLAEFAIQKKACVVIPNPQLVGGHQLKNAEALADKNAIKLVYEEEIKDQPGILYDVVGQVLDSNAVQNTLGEELGKFARPDSAKELAAILLDTAEKIKSKR